jgi:hypothetical protein
MKYLAWLVAGFVLVTRATVIAAPDFVISLRPFAATTTALLVIACVRSAIGIVLIMSAPASRAPKFLQAAGAIALFAGMATPFFGVERTKAVLAWEAAQGPALMRAEGVFVVLLGIVLSLSLAPRRST